MAISTTYTKQQEDLAKNQAAVRSNKAYNGMKGVSENTANNLGNYQQGYQQSQQVQQANDYLQQIQAQKPQNYNSKYGEQLNALLQQIQNPKDFKYDFNGDELFKYYADNYVQKGKQAAMDVQGQAAALTGGYGNSYGQQVGQQQYQQYLLNLYDKGLDLRDRAYQAYQDKLGNDKDAYNLMAQAENTDYGRYQDRLANWQNERAYAADQLNTERNYDYNQYKNDLDYWTNMAQAEASAAQNQQNFEEGQRQFNESMAQSQAQFEATDKLNWAKLEQDQAQHDADLTEKQREYDRSVAIDYVSAILANGQIPSNELLVAAGLSLEDAQRLIAQVTSGGPSGNNDEEEDNGDGNDISFYDANLAILRDAIQNNDSLKLKDLNPNLNTDQTLADLKQLELPARYQNNETNKKFTYRDYINARNRNPG